MCEHRVMGRVAGSTAWKCADCGMSYDGEMNDGGSYTHTSTPQESAVEHELRRDLAGTVNALQTCQLKASVIRKALECAEACAEQGDTAGILDCLVAMREVMGMPKVSGGAK